jgi:thiamine-monophosphate kinase
LSTPSNTVADLGERAIIDLIRRRLPAAPSWILTGVGDDAAVVEPSRNRADVITTDALVDGIHFDRRFTPPAAVGHRAMAANLSDLAAMGAEPRVALLSLVLPATLAAADLEAIVDGLLALAAAHGVHLVGGNVTRSPGPLVIDVTAIGAVHHRRVLTRGGARPGDEVWVSGTIGAAAAGLQMLQAGVAATDDVQACMDAYLAPQPRLRLGSLLGRNRAASACVDLSDGLADGLAQLANASGLAIEVDREAVPLHPATRAWLAARTSDAVAVAAAGGDDYELLFTVSPRQRSRLRAVQPHLRGLTVTRIGRAVAGSGTWLTWPGGRERLGPGYEHFR